ncbi:mitochondrial intermembrane space import and assembly protein 40-B, putative [Pediculus humanus corporis]|uniref:Mitochondrial intermembrane space import and assembly protein 40-B, putative n=1 Tax=Pediculus humanus subsp. corporis TaxID=121224 RepID=E0W067_PEDHC|nr:mitochondrial intermembrane space import and assembly protein 40-B, putative [Pediculus humanus corporis]EEB19023.1 mitochondrial intermembrane space import and assembly protein 40-B, putative [Pediculus humanus corporis]
MSTYRKEGKDVIIFATPEDHKEPSSVVLPEPEPQPGLILPNGEINWNCPCLGGMATGPCGVEFREAFSCFHNSEAEPKGSDCYDAFKEMHLCMAEYPQLYSKYDDDDDELNLEADKVLANESTMPKEEPKITTQTKMETDKTDKRVENKEFVSVLSSEFNFTLH